MTDSAPERFRSIKGALLVGCLGAGALVGAALHLSDHQTFPWWEVGAASISAVFALGAYLRRARWEEKSAAAMLAAFLLALPVVTRSLWFLMCMVIVIFGYWLLVAAVQMQRKAKGE